MEPHPSEIRRSRHREEARRTILDATEAILLEDGIELFSIRKLATRCGFTAPTIYHYFHDKDGLIDALLEERFSRLLQRVRRVRIGPDHVANMREHARAYLRFAHGNQAFYQLMMRGARDGQEPRIVRAADETRAIMSVPLQALAAAGRLYADDLDAAQQSLWALLHGLISLQIGNPKYPWSKNLSDVALDAMLRGIVRPSGEKGPPR
jgi:AcrR family transcriptional regulator